MALEEKIDCANPRYHTGYATWEKIAIYAGAALAAGYLAALGAYISCAGNVETEKPKIENAHQADEIDLPKIFQ